MHIAVRPIGARRWQGEHGETHEEIGLSFAGLLCGTAFLAYCTSSIVSLVTSLNQVHSPLQSRTRTHRPSGPRTPSGTAQLPQ